MSTQRAIAAAFFSVVIVVVLAAIIYTDRVSSTNTDNVYILQHDVPAGQIVAANDFVQQSVHADEKEFTSVERRSLEQLVGQTRYLINMHSADILRADDLAAAQKSSEVPILLKAETSPVFAVGDRIDVYAFYNGQSVLVSGTKGVFVVSVGSPTVIAVPSDQEPFWVTLAFGKPDMVATRAGGQLPTVLPTTNDVGTALCTLSGNRTICGAISSPAGSTPGGSTPTGQ